VRYDVSVRESPTHHIRMKTTAIAILLTALLSFVGNAAEAVHRAKIKKIAGQTQQTPEFQVSGPKDKSTKPRYWLEIEAEVEVETTDPSGFIPELEAKWFAVIMDKNSRAPVRLLGTVTFKNLRTADRKVFLSAYIEPDTLERLTGKSRPSDSDIEGYALTISGPGIVSDGRHAKGLAMATAEEKTKWWVEWKNKDLDGLIVPKSKTPFAPLWTDRYPTEKAENP